MNSLFVVGCARSGASVVAGMHARGAFPASRELHQPSRANPGGNFESLSVQEINEVLLASLTPAEQLLQVGQYWLSRLAPGVGFDPVEEVHDAMRVQLERPACIKDARLVWTLPSWKKHAPEAKTVCVFRSPVATAESIVETVGLYPKLTRPTIELGDAYELWIAVHQRILEHLREEGDWHFMHIDQVFSERGLDALSAFTGHPVNRSLPIPELRRSACASGAPPEAQELYAELCVLAGFKPEEEIAAVSIEQPITPEVAVVLPIREQDRVHVESRLRELRAQRNVATEIILIDQTTEGGIEAPGVRVIREPSPSRGGAYKRALEATRADWIAWQDPAVSPLPHRLARQLAFVRENPSVSLCTSAIALRGDEGGFERHAAIDLAACALPGFWQSGVLIRRDALSGIDDTCFVPAELELYRDLSAEGLVGHTKEVLGSVPRAYIAVRDDQEKRDDELLRLAQLPRIEEPTVTVLMACYNRREALMECLAGFSRQLLPLGTIELIVVDDGSSDGTQELVRSLSLPVSLRFIEQENGGAASARNRGLPQARGEYVLFVNDDTIPFGDTVKQHIEAHRELAGQKAIVLGTFEQPEEERGKNLTRLMEETTLIFAYPIFDRDLAIGGTSFYTCNVSLERVAVEAAGLFDEAFPLFAEDTDYGMRLEDLGYRTYFRPEARAIHRHVQPFDAIKRRQFVVGRAHVRLYAKHPRSIIPRLKGKTVESLWAGVKGTDLAFQNAQRAARSIGNIDLSALEAVEAGEGELAARLQSCFAELIKRINSVLWGEGLIDGLERYGVAGINELTVDGPTGQVIGSVASRVLEPGKPRDLSVLALVTDDDLGHVYELVEDAATQAGLAAEVVLVDMTTHGDLHARGARVVRTETISRGTAWKVALEASTCDLVAWVRPGCRLQPGYLQRAMEALEQDDQLDLVMGEYSVFDEKGKPLGRPSQAGQGQEVDAYWESSVVMRREVLASIRETVFFPIELALLRELENSGRVGKLPELAFHVPMARYGQEQPRVQQDNTLVALGSGRGLLGKPELSVSLVSKGFGPEFLVCLEGYARQLLPGGTFELVIVTEGWSEKECRGLDELEWGVPMRLYHQDRNARMAPRNASVAKAEGRLLLLAQQDVVPDPNCIAGHLRAHEGLPSGKKCAVLGALTAPPTMPSTALARYLSLEAEDVAWKQVSPGGFHSMASPLMDSFSVALADVRAAGGMDPVLRDSKYEVIDLALRLEGFGHEMYHESGARAYRCHPTNFASYRSSRIQEAHDRVRVLCKHPRVFASLGFQDTTHNECLQYLQDHSENDELLEAAAAELAGIELVSLVGLGGESVDVAKVATQDLTKILDGLQRSWQCAGTLAGFRERGIASFEQLRELGSRQCARRTGTALRLVAWPNWADMNELDSLLKRVEPIIAGSFAELVLCHDPARDPEQTEALGRLQESYARLFTDEPGRLNVTIESRALEHCDFLQLGASVDALLPMDQEPQEFGRLIGAERLRTVKDVASWRDRFRTEDDSGIQREKELVCPLAPAE